MIMGILTHKIFELMSLTPLQKWESARKLEFNTPIITNTFILICVAVLLVLILLLVLVNRLYNVYLDSRHKDPFDQYGRQKGLSKAEIHIMKLISRSMPLADVDSLFAVPEIFNNGARKIVHELLARGRNDEAEEFKAELSYLREKLGFIKKLPQSGIDINQKDLSSRQIEIGTKVTVTPRMIKERFDEIACEVVKNTFSGFVLRLSSPIDIQESGLWYIRYYFGANIWEFDTTLLSAEGDLLTFAHSDEIRFVNRRRFLRVPVYMPGLVARLSFSYKKPLSLDKLGPIHDDISADAIGNYSGPLWGTPEFHPVVITELGGPGLRMTVPFEMFDGDRVLVIFRVKHVNIAEETKVDYEAEIIQDVGEVKNIKKFENGNYSIAVELTSTNEVHIAKLIQVTNKVSVERDAIAKMHENQNQPAVEPVTI